MLEISTQYWNLFLKLSHYFIFLALLSKLFDFYSQFSVEKSTLFWNSRKQTWIWMIGRLFETSLNPSSIWVTDKQLATFGLGFNNFEPTVRAHPKIPLNGAPHFPANFKMWPFITVYTLDCKILAKVRELDAAHIY